jgi:acetoin utilization protein AcuC
VKDVSIPDSRFPIPETAFVFDERTLSYDLGAHHPFKAIRPQAVRGLLESYGVELNIVSSERASSDDILTVHSRAYVHRVRRASSGEEVSDALDYGIGTSDTPIFPHMHEATSSVVGGTLEAARLVMSGTAKRALNLAGGLHHAQRDKGSGFCVYNDLSVAIRAMTSSGLRVAYLDVDAHHGDGVQWLHYDEAEALTISFHETGRYLFPGTGFTYELGRGPGLGYSLNVPLEPFTQDDSYLECLERVLEPVLAWYKPDVLLIQGGADSHQSDPLADLCLTTQGYSRVYRLAVQLAQAHAGGRVIATGGGGYAYMTAVPRVWTQLYAALEGIQLPLEIPEAWLEAWQPHSEERLPRTMLDEAIVIPRRPDIQSRNAHTVSQLLEAWRSVTVAHSA